VQLASADVPPYGRVWSPDGNARHVRKLAVEVEEYFDLGLELHSGDVVFDVGANIGLFALAAARRIPELRFFAFEPIPALYRALEKNLGEAHLLNGSGSKLFQLGVSRNENDNDAEFFYFRNFPSDSTRYIDDKRKEFQKFFQTKADGWRRAKPTLIPGAVADVLADVFARLPEGPVGRWVSDRVTGLEKHRCRMTTLSRVITDENLEKIDAIKVDVEGAEMDVLAGIAPEHWKRVRQVVIEGHDDNGNLARVRALLAEAGFEKVVVTRPAGSEEIGLNNFLLFAKR
jgi:FkbM family methyltransferase